jgi:hypothetical protein
MSGWGDAALAFLAPPVAIAKAVATEWGPRPPGQKTPDVRPNGELGRGAAINYNEGLNGAPPPPRPTRPRANDPPPDYVNRPSANLQSEFRTGQDQLYPGYGEEYWYQNQNLFAPGGNAQDYFNQTSQGAFAAPGSGEQYWAGVQGNQGPQATAFAWQNAQNQLQGPSAVDNYWGQTQAGFGAPTESSQFQDWAQPQLQGPGAVQQYGAQALGQFGGPTASQGQYASSAGALQGPTGSEQYAQRTVPQLGQQTASEAYFQQAVPQFQNQPRNAQDAFNQFQGGPMGLDPYYEQAKARTVEDTNRGLAASGLLGSSYGAQAMTDSLGQLNAEQANREAEYRILEAKTRGDLARGADIGQTDFFRTGGQLAGQADNSRLAAMGLGGELMGQADQSRLSQELGMGDLAGMSDQTRLAMLMGGADIAGGMSSEQLARLGMGGDLAGQDDASWLARTMGGADVAAQADSGLLGRVGLFGDLGSQYDQNDLTRMLGMGGLALDAQAAGLDRQGQGYNQALGLDEFGLNEATRGMQAAGGAQNLYDDRIQRGFDNQFGFAGALSGIQGQAYNDMFGSDQALMDAMWASQVGQYYQDYMAGLAQQQQSEQGLMNGVGTVADLYSMGGSAGGRAG